MMNVNMEWNGEKDRAMLSCSFLSQADQRQNGIAITSIPAAQLTNADCSKQIKGRIGCNCHTFGTPIVCLDDEHPPDLDECSWLISRTNWN
jgi:hypothetical protein